MVLETGEVIPYEHLVFATGSIWTGALALPDSKTAAMEHFRSFRKNLSVAQHVLIVGGGSVGLGEKLCIHILVSFSWANIFLSPEYAGEILHYYPEMKVTIVHGGSELLNKTYPAKYRKSLLEAVTTLGAQVVLGDKISPAVVPEGGYVVTEKGQRIQVDLVITAAGGRPNSE